MGSAARRKQFHDYSFYICLIHFVHYFICLCACYINLRSLPRFLQNHHAIMKNFSLFLLVRLLCILQNITCLRFQALIYFPTSLPSSFPASFPTSTPSLLPSIHPSVEPSTLPTSRPTTSPTSQPTRQPSKQPIRRPSAQPTRQPSRQPTSRPSR